MLTGRRSRTALRTVVTGAVLALVVTACTTGGGEAPTSAPPPPPTPSPATAIDLPDHAAGRAAAWVLTLLEPDHPATLAPDELERLAPSFLEAIPATDLATVLTQLRASGPWVPTRADGGPDALDVRISAGATELAMSVAVDGEGLITGLWFGEPPPDREPAASWEELLDEVAALPARTSLAAYTDGCAPVAGTPAGTAPGEALPIGSMIKLYVLGAVVDAVADGELAWDDEVVVTDALRSLPSGRLQDEPAGTAVTVREAAGLMISISDNTATDLLVHAVGRERVEAALTTMGMADPSPNIPLLTTRELFHVGWAATPDERAAWASGDPERRRALLAGIPDGPPVVDVAALAGQPVWEQGVDWFATADDLCAAHTALQELARTPAGEPVRGILAENPGVDLGDAWTYVAFKGGSAPGTVGGAWYAEDADGRATVVVLQTAAASVGDAVATTVFAGLVEDAFRLRP